MVWKGDTTQCPPHVVQFAAIGRIHWATGGMPAARGSREARIAPTMTLAARIRPT